MKTVRITRVASNPQHGTFGTVVVGGQPLCLSLEPYKRDNAQNISCIPAGQYVCKPFQSPTYGATYIVTEVPGRYAILFHWGNRDVNTEGCILLGEEFGELGGDWAIKSSRKAVEEFQNVIGRNSFLLTIVESF